VKKIKAETTKNNKNKKDVHKKKETKKNLNSFFH